MTPFLSKSRPFALGIALAVSLSSASHAAAPRKGKSAATAKRPATKTAAKPAKPVANNAIIPLPLQPMVPASQRVCSLRMPSGLGYTMLRDGAGAKPGASDTVLVNYLGYLAATGAVFDQNTRAPLPVGDVIAGFSQGLQMLSKGAVVRLCIPAVLGYGDRASGPIPANSDLVFQVELIDFKSAAEIEALRAEQNALNDAGAEGEPAQRAEPETPTARPQSN